MSRLAKISFIGFVRGLLLLLLLAMSLLSGLQLLLDPHVNTVPTGNGSAYTYSVIDPPLNAKNIQGIDTKWISPLRMDQVGIMTLAILYLVLPFAYLALASAEKRFQRGIVGKGNLGEDICLRPEAVERVIVREVRTAVEDVTRVISCEVLQGSKSARVNLSVGVSDRSTVPDVQKRVRAVVMDTLTRLIGYADGSQVTVKVSEVAGAAVPAARRKGRPNRMRREIPAAKA